MRLAWFIGSLVHWFTGSLNRWFTDSLTLESLNHWFIHSLIRWSTELNEPLTNWIVYSLIHWSLGSVLRWFSESLFHHFIESLMNRWWLIDSTHGFLDSAILIDSSIHWPAESVNHLWFIGSLIRWFTDYWLIDSLRRWTTDPLIHWFTPKISHSLIIYIYNWTVEPLLHLFIDSVIHWLIALLICCFIDSLTPWLYAWILSCHVSIISSTVCLFVDAPLNLPSSRLHCFCITKTFL